MNLRRAVLITAITMWLIRIQWIIGQIEVTIMLPGYAWGDVSRLVLNAALFLALPAFLTVLYQSGAEVYLSGSLRRLALAACLTQCLLMIPRLLSWGYEIDRNATNIALFREATVARDIQGWLQTANSGYLLWSTLGVMSESGFILVLFFLFQPPERSLPMIPRQGSLVRRTAWIAVIAGVLEIILLVSRGTLLLPSLAGFRPESKKLMAQYACWTMAAWIVFRSASARNSIPPQPGS